MVSASGVFFTELFDNEIANGLVVGVIGDATDTFDGNKTVADCVLFGLNVNVLPFGSFVLHLTATFVPRFNSSMSVASFVSMEFDLLKFVVKWIFLAIVVGFIFVMVVVWHTGIVLVVFASWFGVTTFVVVRVFGVTKLSASIRRRDNDGGAGTANEFWTKKKKNNWNYEI